MQASGMTESTGASWLVYTLGALCAGAIVAAVLVVGPASASQSSRSRTVTVASGVVQSTVSGSGNLQASSQLNLGFKTSGTVTHIYMTQGEQVVQGQLLATLDPQSAEVTLEQAKATLQSSEANLAKQEETGGETSTGQTSSGSSTGNAGTGSTASVRNKAASGIATAAAAPTRTSPSGPPTTTTPASTSPTTTTPGTTTPTTTSKTPATMPPRGTNTTTTPTTTSPSKSTKSSEGKETSSSSSSSKTTVSPATREANLASARAAVKSDKLTVQSDEQAVQDTKLYAPEDGTIASLSGQVGEIVSGSGTTKASSTSSSSSGSGSSSAGGAGASSSGSGRSGTGSSSSAGSPSSGSASSSSSAFAVLSDLSAMQLVAPLSESEIRNVKAGQIATVTVEALEGRKLAAHVSEVAILSTSNSGVVSYDVTFELDQMESGLKPGMSATAEVVVKQAEGVNVPTSAISAGTVTIVQNGKQARRRVVTGLAGNSSTIILSGLRAGEKIALPIAASGTGTSSGSRTGAGASRTGGLGGALGGGGGFPGGGGAIFRGGGG
jgi:macrolide-specific efflux system membrane fusion protein